MSDTVRLRDGTEVPSGLVVSVMATLRLLASGDTDAVLDLYGLTLASRDPERRAPAGYKDRLARRELVGTDGQVDKGVAGIVRNAVIGTDPGMTDWRIVSPLDLEPQP